MARPGSIRRTSSACSTDANNAIAELGYGGAQGEHMVVVENTPTHSQSCRLHALLLLSLAVLGLPPVWYKSAPYRSRAVIDPRGVLREFGLELAAMSKCASGTAPRRCATWFCPSVRRALRT